MSDTGPFGLIAGAASGLTAVTKKAARGAAKHPKVITRTIPTFGAPVAGAAGKVKKPRTQAEHRAFIDRVVTNVHSGVYDEAAGGRILRLAGFPDSRNPFAQSHGRGRIIDAVTAPLTPHRHGAFAAADLARARAGVPNAGIVAPGTGLIAQIAGPISQGLVNAPGSIPAIVTHPVDTSQRVYGHLRHPDLATAAFGTYVLGVGGAAALARGAAISRVARGVEDVPVTIHVGPGAHPRAPNVVVVPQSKLRTAVTRSSEEGGSLLHTPAGKPVRIHVPGQGPKAHPGESAVPSGYTRLYRASPQVFRSTRGNATHYVDVTPADLARPSTTRLSSGRYRLSRTITARSSGRVKEIEGPGPPGTVLPPPQGPREQGITVERPVSRNVLVRPVQRGRGKLLQRAVNRDPRRPLPGFRAASNTVSARTTVARENRAARRVNLALVNADASALDRAVSRLSPAEQNAIGVIAIAGDEALTSPATAVGRQIEAHQHFAALGGEGSADNLQRVADLEAAQSVLEHVLANPNARSSVRFRRAAALAQQVSRDTERRLVEAGLLDSGVARGRLNNMAGIYGYPEAPPGSFFISQKPAYVAEGQRLPAYSGRPSPSRYGTPPPSMSARIPGLGQRMTGESVARGYVAGPQTVARRAVLVNKALEARRYYEDLWRIGSPTKMSQYDIPFRDSAQIRDEVRQFFDRLANTVHSGEDVGGVLSAREIERLAEMLKPDPHSFGNVPVGGSQEGVRWVDRRYDVEMQRAVSGDELYGLVDLVNNYGRTFQLYLRPAYALNLPGNLAMNAVSEGLRVPGAGRQAVIGNRLYGDDVMRQVHAGMGTTLSQSYSIGTGVFGRFSDRLAQAWTGLVDMHARALAFFAEAGRQGVRTPAQMKELFAARPGTPLAAKRTMIFRVAKKNIVDYDTTPFEQNVARRWVYFYPWSSRGTVWALRTLVENPGKTFTLFQLGRIAAENAHRQLGRHQPAWVEHLGLIPAGGKGDIVQTYNPSSLWTYGTAVQSGAAIADTLKSLAGLPQGGAFGDVLTPGMTLITEATQPSQAGPRSTGFPGIVQSLPEYQIARRLGLVGKPSQTYPDTGAVSAVAPFVVGGLAKRGISHAAIARQAVRAAPTPRAKLTIELDQLVEEGVLPPEAADTAKSHLEAVPDKGISYIRRQFGPKLDLAQKIDQWVSAGRISEERASAAKATLLTMTPAQIDEARKALTEALG